MAKLKPNQFEIRPGVIITERPILFQTEMAQAILEDRKTQTRRTKGLESFINEDVFSLSTVNGENIKAAMIVKPDHFHLLRSPFGQPGDLLWVRESFTIFLEGILFKSETEIFTSAKWKPSIHMPKDYAQRWLMVEDIRVERVQDISREDALAEGIKSYTLENGYIVYKDYEGAKHKEIGLATCHWPEGSFRRLWTSINGHDSWKSNPWVWVIQYRILSKTGRPDIETILQAYTEITSGEKEVSRV